MQNWPHFDQLSLEPSPEEWRALVEQIALFLNDELEALGSEPVVHDDVEEATDSRDLAAYLKSIFEPGFNPAHPGFMAYIPGGGLVTSALADWIIKTMNRYGTAHFAAPSLADLEHQVVDMFAGWVGYGPGYAGVLTTGGSLANFTALVTARRAMLPEDFLGGVIYCSDQTHHSVMKAANLAGFSSRNMRMIASNSNFQLDIEALRDQIVQDLDSEMTPFLVVGSAGTTNTGSIDPLPEMAALAQTHNLWFHVDAAYGGAFLLTQRGRERLAGIAEADSVTLDPHKGLFLPYGTGGILVRNKDRLLEAHEMRGDYMPDLDRERAHLDPFSLSVELSREHRGLKVALPFMLHGKDAFQDALDEKLDLTNWLYETLSGIDQIEIVNAPELSTFAFKQKGADEGQNRALMDRINGKGRVYLSATILNGEFVIRVSILSHRTHMRDVEHLVSDLRMALEEM